MTDWDVLIMQKSKSGAVIWVEGFPGEYMKCPRCQTVLVRAQEHRCGDKVAEAVAMRKEIAK